MLTLAHWSVRGPLPKGRLPASGGRHGFQLSLLEAFEFTHEDEPVALNKGTRRLLAFLAIQGRPVPRDVVAEALWPEASQAQSLGRLRTAIWRLEPLAREAILIDDENLELSPEVELDFREATALARDLVSADGPPPEWETAADAIAVLSSQLLPDWDEDWVVLGQGDWRQLRLHAMEALAQKLLDAGRYLEALETAVAAMKVDPLRESPHALMIRIHLAEGNQSEAIKEFVAYRLLLREELNIEPTTQLRGLMRGLMFC